MKLRSIALAGLLGTGLLMTSGCGTSDLTGFVGDLLQQNVVYTVNGYGSDVNFTVGSDSQIVADKSYATNLLTGSSSYAVSYTPNNGITPVSFADGSTYIYTATTCTSAGHLEHEVNTNKVNVINLSSSIISADSNTIVITQADGTEHNVTEAIGGCAVTSVASLNTVVFENDMNISLDGGNTVAYTVTGVDPDMIALGNSLKVDIVIFSDKNMTVVPMAGYDDLVAAGAGAL